MQWKIYEGELIKKKKFSYRYEWKGEISEDSEVLMVCNWCIIRIQGKLAK